MLGHLAQANYFQIHHTPADTVERITPKQAGDNAYDVSVLAGERCKRHRLVGLTKRRRADCGLPRNRLSGP